MISSKHFSILGLIYYNFISFSWLPSSPSCYCREQNFFPLVPPPVVPFYFISCFFHSRKSQTLLGFFFRECGFPLEFFLLTRTHIERTFSIDKGKAQTAVAEREMIEKYEKSLFLWQNITQFYPSTLLMMLATKG